MTDRLKPCPFCGSEAEVIMLSDAGNVGVRCKKCSAVVGEYRFWQRPYAIRVWNTRKPMDRIVEQLEYALNNGIPIVNGKECNRREKAAYEMALEYAIKIVKDGGKNE